MTGERRQETLVDQQFLEFGVEVRTKGNGGVCDFLRDVVAAVHAADEVFEVVTRGRVGRPVLRRKREGRA